MGHCPNWFGESVHSGHCRTLLNFSLSRSTVADWTKILRRVTLYSRRLVEAILADGPVAAMLLSGL